MSQGISYADSSAVLSECGKYRFLLRRRWNSSPDVPYITYVMLNPSTADGSEDDPTIRKCVGFAWRLGAEAIEVVNLFAWRSTDPDELLRLSHSKETLDLVGIGDPRDDSFCRNDEVVLASAVRAKHVIVAWGAHTAASSVGARDRVVLSNLLSAGIQPMCLGRSKNGAPRHPLMLSYEAKLIPFERAPT